MKDVDVERCITEALTKAGLNKNQKPKLLSDNGPCYKSAELKGYLESEDIKHIHGSPHHPQTQGKIERWHRSMKNQILLNNYYLPGELQEHFQHFITYYNHDRYHKSLNNLTPADVYYGRGQEMLDQRHAIKLNTLAMRRQMYYDNRNNLSLMG